MEAPHPRCGAQETRGTGRPITGNLTHQRSDFAVLSRRDLLNKITGGRLGGVGAEHTTPAPSAAPLAQWCGTGAPKAADSFCEESAEASSPALVVPAARFVSITDRSGQTPALSVDAAPESNVAAEAAQYTYSEVYDTINEARAFVDKNTPVDPKWDLESLGSQREAFARRIKAHQQALMDVIEGVTPGDVGNASAALSLLQERKREVFAMDEQIFAMEQLVARKAEARAPLQVPNIGELEIAGAHFLPDSNDPQAVVLSTSNGGSIQVEVGGDRYGQATYTFGGKSIALGGAGEAGRAAILALSDLLGAKSGEVDDALMDGKSLPAGLDDGALARAAGAIGIQALQLEQG
jgi:hypothetical protein